MLELTCMGMLRFLDKLWSAFQVFIKSRLFVKLYSCILRLQSGGGGGGGDKENDY